jgi:hypothetical protein
MNMISRSLRCLAVAALSASGMAVSGGGARAGERIDLVERWSGYSCFGMCLDDDLTVLADGRASDLHRMPASTLRNICQGHSAQDHAFCAREASRQPRIFQLPPDKAEQFRRELAPLKPEVSLDDDTDCYVKDHQPGVWDVQIRWSGENGEIILRTCSREARLAAGRADEVARVVAAK